MTANRFKYSSSKIQYQTHSRDYAVVQSRCMIYINCILTIEKNSTNGKTDISLSAECRIIILKNLPE